MAQLLATTEENRNQASPSIPDDVEFREAASPDPEVPEHRQAKRRRFSAKYKLDILRKADGCTEKGQLGKLLRREGLYSSHLTNWRRQRDEGSLKGLRALIKITSPSGTRSIPAVYVARRLHIPDMRPSGALPAERLGPQLDEFILTRVLTPKRRGRKAKKSPQSKRVVELEGEVRRLRQKLEQAEVIIDIQKKVSSLLGMPMNGPESGENDC